MEVDLEVDVIAGVLVITATGDLVRGALAPLERCLEKAMDAGRPVVLDLLAAEAVDKEGMRLLEAAHARLGARLRVVVRRGDPLHTALKDTGLAHALALHSSAVSALGAAEPLTRRFARDDARVA
jgi:anti-anti-sigma regulatory factor